MIFRKYHSLFIWAINLNDSVFSSFFNKLIFIILISLKVICFLSFWIIFSMENQIIFLFIFSFNKKSINFVIQRVLCHILNSKYYFYHHIVQILIFDVHFIFNGINVTFEYHQALCNLITVGKKSKDIIIVDKNSFLRLFWSKKENLMKHNDSFEVFSF
jgi:hypothetical protein